MSDPQDPVRLLLAEFGSKGDDRWNALCESLASKFERDITIEAILFLIGIQTRGLGYEPKIHRDRKQDVIMEGTFAAFESIGFYRRVGMEADGAWIWQREVSPPNDLSVEEQETLLKIAILEYFAGQDSVR